MSTRQELVSILMNETDDLEHAEASVRQFTTLTAGKRLEYKNPGDLRMSVVDNAGDKATMAARNEILTRYPHDFLAMHLVPSDGPCFACLWSNGYLEPWDWHDHPLKAHGETKWTKQWARGAWLTAFIWAKSHTPDGHRVEEYDPVVERYGLEVATAHRKDEAVGRLDEARAALTRLSNKLVGSET